MSSDTDTVRVTCYGPSGLVQAVRGTRWTTVVGSNESFRGIGLGGYCLNRPTNEHCSLQLEVVIKDGEDEFTVTGWCFPDVLKAIPCAMVEDDALRTISGGTLDLARRPLTPEPTERNTVRYELEVRPLTSDTSDEKSAD